MKEGRGLENETYLTDSSRWARYGIPRSHLGRRAVMDKSSRGEKLNVELVSDHFRKRIAPSERLSINFRRARTSARREYFFARGSDKCAVMRLISYLRVSANRPYKFLGGQK